MSNIEANQADWDRLHELHRDLDDRLNGRTSPGDLKKLLSDLAAVAKKLAMMEHSYRVTLVVEAKHPEQLPESSNVLMYIKSLLTTDKQLTLKDISISTQCLLKY